MCSDINYCEVAEIIFQSNLVVKCQIRTIVEQVLNVAHIFEFDRPKKSCMSNLYSCKAKCSCTSMIVAATVRVWHVGINATTLVSTYHSCHYTHFRSFIVRVYEVCLKCKCGYEKQLVSSE